MSSASAVRLSPSVQKQKLKLELLRGSRLKLESLPVSVVVHEHLVRAGCMFFGTATVILQIFGVVLFSVISVVNVFTEIKKTPIKEKIQ